VLLPVPADGLVTAGLMAVLTVLAALAVRRVAADRRPVLVTVSLAAATLAAVWWLAASGRANGDGLTLANDVALIVAAVAVVAGSSPSAGCPARSTGWWSTSGRPVIPNYPSRTCWPARSPIPSWKSGTPYRAGAG